MLFHKLRQFRVMRAGALTALQVVRKRFAETAKQSTVAGSEWSMVGFAGLRCETDGENVTGTRLHVGNEGYETSSQYLRLVNVQEISIFQHSSQIRYQG